MSNTKNSKNKKSTKAQVEPQQQQQQQLQKEQEMIKKIMQEQSEANNNNNDNNNNDNPFLGRELRVELSDGRVLVGTLVAYMGIGDILLSNAIEKRQYKDGEINLRPLSLVAVPFKHVAAMQRRELGCAPLTLVQD